MSSHHFVIEVLYPDDGRDEFAHGYMFESLEEALYYQDWKKRIQLEKCRIHELLWTVEESLPLWGDWLEDCMKFTDFFGKNKVPQELRDVINAARQLYFNLDSVDFGLDCGEWIDRLETKLVECVEDGIEQGGEDRPIRIPSP